jgi:hypothetical protein
MISGPFYLPRWRYEALRAELLAFPTARNDDQCAGQARDAAQCLLVIIGATPEGKKELVGLTDGVRESAQS